MVRFINDVEWESPEHWRAAHNPEFMAKAAGPNGLSSPRLPRSTTSSTKGRSHDRDALDPR